MCNTQQRLSRRRQNEIMAKIQAAIIQIPKPASNRTLKALEAQKMMKKKKDAEVSDSCCVKHVVIQEQSFPKAHKYSQTLPNFSLSF